ncbi:helix-turn-helix domain-containing protein [Variovorax sp. JS1663]|uniref:helix-turn-helix domain-containing protein n=1 Tax=Variovorax sp. JS1663 TaxID=1851577 RepID=UPI000B3496BE|nr:helix-turn-helix transcriptional regulator [Variovorax sp. JS1663]OUM04442.1 XRE family transcriptional regulator [Variovorax sp. JS1663]
MVNIASVLKAEIARVARREVRAEIEQLKKASSSQRSAIAQLRRQIAALEKALKQARRQSASATRTQVASSENTPRRFSASRLAAHRAKLGLSAAAYGKLVGMSGATVYLWEQGKSRPNAEQLQKIAAIRALSRTALLQQLSDG